MKWIGQHIWPMKSRFRSDVIIEKESSLYMGDDEVLSQSGGNVTLSNISALDATTISTLSSSVSSVNIDGLTALGGTGLHQTQDHFLFSDNGTEKKITFSNLEDAIFSHVSGNASIAAGGALTLATAQGGITSLGTLTGLTLGGDKTITPNIASGSMVQVDANVLTDNNTSPSGTAASFSSITIMAPVVAAAEVGVTVTDAATLYVRSAPAAGTNMTLTNAYAIWVDAGSVRLDGGLIMDGNTITGIDDSGEFTNDDAHIMTSAAIEDKILGYGYAAGDITGVTAGTGLNGGGTGPGSVTLNVEATHTAITSITNANLNVGYGEEAQITFAETGFTYTSDGAARLVVTDTAWSPTHNHIDLGETDKRFKNIYVEEIVATNGSFSGNLSGGIDITANNTANETCYPVFVDGATGNQGLESDTGLTYNPQDGNLTSNVFTGNLTGAADTAATVTGSTQAAIESIGTDGDTLSILSDDVLIRNGTSGKPVLTLKTTHTDKDQSAELQFLKDAADTEDGEDLGKITFYGEDEGNNNTQFAEIKAEISESDETDEAGKLTLSVAESDGTTTTLTPGLILEGEHATDGEVDATIGNGAGSVVTIPGQLLAKNGGMGARHYGTHLKILPSDFVQNEDGGVNKSIQFDDTGTVGLRATSTNAELWAFIPIPEGMKVTHIHIKGLDSGVDGSNVDDFAFGIYDYNLYTGSISSMGTGDVGTGYDLGTALESTISNCAAIVVDTNDIDGSDTDVVYGGFLVIEPI